MTPHIEAKPEEIASIVLMPGDPRRAEYIARNYLEDYVLVNSVREEHAYTGYYKNKRVTVFSSGMGIPSMGIYSYELFNNYDVEVILRIGSCGSYTEELCIHDILLATHAYSTSDYAKEVEGEDKNIVEPSKQLNELIIKTAKKLNTKLVAGGVHSTEAFYNNLDYKEISNKYNTLGVEMETFSLFTNAKRTNKKAAALLTVTDSFITNEKMSSAERERDLNKMILLALESIINL